MAALTARCPTASITARPAQAMRAPGAAALRPASSRALLAPRTSRRVTLSVRAEAASAEQATTTTTTTAPPAQPEAGKVFLFNAPEFDSLLEVSKSRLVVVDVFTQWCGPCKMIAPELEKMAEEFGDKCVISKIDCTSIPENKKWAMGQQVKALPTFLLFKGGSRVGDMTGAKAANLRKLIETHM